MSRPWLRYASLTVMVALVGCAQQGSAPASSSAVNPPPMQQNQATVGQEVGAVANNKIEIDFGPGSDRLTPDADKQLDTAARLFRDVRPVSMYSNGYSDAIGDEYGNLLLSARRARAVKAALVARGIPANQILLRAYGISDPIDKAAPDAAGNRRVVVNWAVL